MVATSADEETPLLKEDDDDKSSLDFISQRILDRLNLLVQGIIMMGGMYSWAEEPSAATAKSTIRKGLRFILLTSLGILCFIWLWFVFVFIVTKKGCPCKGDMRLWLGIIIIAFAVGMFQSVLDQLWLNVPGRADPIIDEIFSSGDDVRRWSSQLGQKLELDTLKRFKRLQCGCLISQFFLWLTQALQYCLPFYGAFCLYRASSECCGLLYYTCLVVTVFSFFGYLIELINWRKGLYSTEGMRRGGG